MAFQGNGFYIFFENDLPQLIGICSHCAGEVNYPGLLTPDEAEIYILPLTETQMFELFGKPERVYEVNEIRY